MAEWAEAFLVLRVDQSVLRKDIEDAVRSAKVPKVPVDADTTAAERATGTFRDKLKVPVKIPVDADSTRAKAVTDDLRRRLAELTAKVTTAKLGADDRDALLKVRGLEVRLARLSAKVANPKIKIDGVARAAAELAGLDLAFDKLDRTAGGGGGGVIGKIGGLLSGGGGAASSGGGMGALGITGIAAAAAAAVPVIASLTTVTVGAGAGLGAFGLIAMSTFRDLQAAMSAVSTANDNFAQAAGLVDTAVKTSGLDLKTYRESLALLPPGLRSAQKLLGDTNVTWQGLSTMQQNNVVALSQNKDALKNMLPAQKTALAALLASKKAWDDLTPAQQTAATALHTVSDAWGKLTAAFEPAVLSVLAQAAGLVVKAIGPIGALAADAVWPLKQIVNTVGVGLIGFLKGIEPLVAPSLGALNMIMAQLFKSLNGNLVPAMVKGLPNFIRLAEALGKLAAFGINVIAVLFRLSDVMINNAIRDLHLMAEATDHTRIYFIHMAHDGEAAFNTVKNTVGTVVSRIALAFGDMKTALKLVWAHVEVDALTVVEGILTGFSHIPFIGKYFKTAAKAIHDEIVTIQGYMNSLAGHTVNIPISFASPAGGRKPLAMGGFVPGNPALGDVIPALLKGGETVFPETTPEVAALARAYRLPGFAAGGFVDFPERTTFSPSLAAIQSRMAAAVQSLADAFGRTLLGPGGGGAMSHPAIAADWMAAGGPGGFTARVATAITGAESGFNPRAVQQGQPYATTGWGLWQITPGNSEPQAGTDFQLLNPFNNAIAAVAKFRGAGDNFTPWTTYMSGAFEQFMDRGGVLQPGWNRVYNGLGRAEPLVPAGGGDTHYHIDVHVPPTANLAEVGAVTVRAIQAYERGNTAAWRK